MRGVNGDSSIASETINAAVSAIASAESRGAQQSVQKRRWGGWWSIYWCFGSYKHKKRIGHAVLVPETSLVTDAPAPSNLNQAPSNLVVLPFIAPPSSPASFLQSEPPSMTQSPTGVLSFTSMSAGMYSPGPTSIFAIGPYAHETQLVSPPVFSTFTTEPSTAPFTPPPESVHLTTPSSPEVPFARLLDPNLRGPVSYYEFQSYHLQPGSPIGQLISPSSGISGSGTSSPFPDPPPKVLNLDGLSSHDWSSRRDSGSLTPPDATKPESCPGFLLFDQSALNHRVSFELSTDPAAARRDHHAENSKDGEDGDRRHQKNMSITLGSIKEFNFDSSVEGGNGHPKPANGQDWSFFPVIQSGLS